MSYTQAYSNHAFMNPGPAPAIPFNNNTSTNTNNNNNDNNYHHHHTNTISNASTSSGNSVTHNRSNSNENKTEGRIIKQGWVSIKEDGSMRFMWTKKYLILRDGALEMLKNEVSIY